MVVNEGIKASEIARERDVAVTWREIKCVDKMGEQQMRDRAGERSHLDRLMVMRQSLRSLQY